MATTPVKLKRIEALEERLPPKPCKRHPGLHVFIQGDADFEKKLAAVERCQRCKGRQRLVIRLERFGGDASGQVQGPAVPIGNNGEASGQHQQYLIEQPEWLGRYSSHNETDPSPPALTLGDGDNSNDDDWLEEF
jgi:hypothetical protein